MSLLAEMLDRAVETHKRGGKPAPAATPVASAIVAAIPAARAIVSVPVPPRPSVADLERARLRAELEAARAENARLRARVVPADAPVEIERDPNGKGNLVLYRWHQRRPVSLWPSQVDDLVKGVKLDDLPPGHLLRRLVLAAGDLPRSRSED